MCASATVHVRVDSDTKARATKALGNMGLSVSDGVRLFLQMSAEGHPPLPIKVPSATAIKAMDELRNGGGKKFVNVEDLFKDLGI